MTEATFSRGDRGHPISVDGGCPERHLGWLLERPAGIDSEGWAGHDLDMPLLPPHDPESHEHQEPEDAGFMWWAKEVAKLAAWSAVHGEIIDGNEAAKRLGVTRQRVAALAERGVIRRLTAGRHSFYPVADLQAWDERRKNGEPVTGGRGRKASPVFELAS